MINGAIFYLYLTVLVYAITGIPTFPDADAQRETSDASSSSLLNQTTAGTDFQTLRESYLDQWQQLDFQSVFDTFVEDGSVEGFGVYDERPSNIFSPDTRTIVLYVEPVGYGFQEGVDEEGNVLYLFNFSATVEVSDNQGNPLTEPIPADFGDPLISHNKATEAFMPITLTLDQPLPIGEYSVTYTITDATTGKSFEIPKDIRVVETLG